jgi:hypothetical protein
MKKPDEASADTPVDFPTSTPTSSPAKAKISVEPFTEPSPQEIKKESNPFTDSDWRMWTYAWSGFLLRLMLVFGASFSIYQYLVQREEKRVERSFALIELWERPEYQDAQKALRERLGQVHDRLKGQLSATPTQAQLEFYYRKVGTEAMTAADGAAPLGDVQASFDRVLYFLNRVSSCTTTNLCSKSVSDEYFRDYAQTFWGYFSGYIRSQRRAGSTTLAESLETYLKVDAPASAPSDSKDPASK